MSPMSRTYAARAIMLRKTKLGESDLIVTMLSSEGVQIRAVAKGARKPSSKFGARIEPFTVADAMLARGRTLDVLTEVETVESHDLLRQDYDAVRAASVVAELLDRSTAERQAEERLYQLGVAALDVLEASDAASRPALVAAFLAKAMAMQGYRPKLSGCVSCGGEDSAPTAFSVDGGGVVCSACASSDPSALPVSAALPGVLALLLRTRLTELAAAGLPEVLVREALTLMRAYVGCHLPARMRALDAYVRG